MDSLIKVGLLLIAAIIIIHTIKKHKEDGKLFYHRWLFWLGIGCLGFVSLLTYNLIVDKPIVGSKEFILAITLIVAFAFTSIVALLEYKITHGEYGKYGIVYTTPWSKTKRYSWFNIEKVEYNSIMNWYIFYTDDGNKMRFSSYLSGIDGLIEFATAMGHDIEVYYSLVQKRGVA